MFDESVRNPLGKARPWLNVVLRCINRRFSGSAAVELMKGSPRAVVQSMAGAAEGEQGGRPICLHGDLEDHLVR